MKTVTVRVNRENYIKSYIRIWNGLYELTRNENDLLYVILDRYLKLAEDGVKEPYISQLVFQPQELVSIRKELGLKTQNFNNYKASLRKKKVLLQNGDSYLISPKLIPMKELAFKFIVDGE